VEIKNIFDFEKKLVFLVNFFLILIIICFFLFNLEMKYFFYFNIILTFILSYIFFQRSRKLSKTLILTNLFIFFYFLYPSISQFLYELLGVESYVFIIFYNIFISYIFLVFSGNHKNFFGDIKKTNFKFLFIIIVVGLSLGLFFYFLKEPIPSIFLDVMINNSNTDIILFLLFNSFIVALSEQMIFSGFLFNTYKKLTTKYEAIFHTSIIFVLFHLLRINILINYYFKEFKEMFILYLVSYYFLLFLFMFLALYLYSLKTKKYEGNFTYPLFLHFAADFSLFFFYYFFINIG